jgi:hypothetical protein
MTLVDRDTFDPEGLALVTGVGPDAAGRPKALALAESLTPVATARGVKVHGLVADVDLDLGPGFYLGRSGAVVLAVDTLHAVLSVSRDVALAGAALRLLRLNLAGIAGAQVCSAAPNPEGACLACALQGDHGDALAAERSCTSPKRHAAASTRAQTSLAAAWLGATLAADALREVPREGRFRKVDLRAGVTVIDAWVERSARCLAGHLPLGPVTRCDRGPAETTARDLGLGRDGARLALPGSQALWEGLRCAHCAHTWGAVHFGPARAARCPACDDAQGESYASFRASLGPEDIDPDRDLGALGLPAHAVVTVLRTGRAEHFTFTHGADLS